MKRHTTPVLRHLGLIAALPITAVASLAMAQANAGIGANFLELWLLGWFSLLLLAMPTAWWISGRVRTSDARRVDHRQPAPSTERGQQRS